MSRIAFLLQTHDANPHLERLCGKLTEFPGARIFCHHDFSKGEPHPAVRQIATFCQPHRVTAWAKVSATLAELDLFKIALEQAPECDWLVLVSGSCYPLKPIDQITDFLDKTPYQGFVDSNLVERVDGLSGWWWTKVFTRPLCRIPFLSRRGRFYWRELRIKRQDTPFQVHLQLRYGSNWIILKRPVAEDLMAMNPHDHPVMRFFDKVERQENKHMSPEESLVQCLLGDLVQHQVMNGNLRFIDWENSTHWHPNTLTERHWEAVQASDALFGRKFDATESKKLLDLIDAQ